MEKIQTLSFEEACQKTGRDAATALRYAEPVTNEEKADNAIKRLEIFTEAYNMQGEEKWVPDYSKRDSKWYPWFVWDSALSAFRFDSTSGAYTHAYAATGSRHVSRSSEIAEHIGRAHIDDWNLWLKK